MADPQFPDVPQAPGVPPVRRDGPLPGGEKQINSASALLASGKNQYPWGIYNQGGQRVLFPDNIVAFEYSSEYRVSDYPLEKGSFETYNKVEMPYSTRLMMSKGGDLASRTEFLKTLQDIKGDRILYNVVTPEKTYLNVNIDHVSMTRTNERGTAMLTVEVGLREIRQNATLAYSTSPAPEGAPATPTPKQDKRPPTTNPGTTRTPNAARPYSRGPSQPTRRPPLTRQQERRVIADGAAIGLKVEFVDPPGGARGSF